MTIELDDIFLAAANKFADQLRHELKDHSPALAEASILFATSVEPGGHTYAPDPVPVTTRLANGMLQMVDTPGGERMRLRISRHAEGLSPSVNIQREGGRTGLLDLQPVAGDHHLLPSHVAPEEPHEFRARSRLAASKGDFLYKNTFATNSVAAES